MPDKSRGHIAFVGDLEFYELDDQVYRAPLSNTFDIRTGARIGRWESSRFHFDYYRVLETAREAYAHL